MSTRGRAVIPAAAIRKRLQSIVAALTDLGEIQARVLAAEQTEKPTRPKQKRMPRPEPSPPAGSASVTPRTLLDSK